MADDKEALPVVAWRTVIRVRALDIIYHYAETPPEGDDLGVEWQLLTDHVTATAALSELRAEVERALGALADIANSDDMTLEVAQNKARRVYEEIRAAQGSAEGGV